MGRKKKDKADERSEDPEDDDGEPRLHPKVIALCQQFNFDERLAWKIQEVMTERRDDFGTSTTQDCVLLEEELGKVRDPHVDVLPKLREMTQGRYFCKAENRELVVQFCKEHRLDKGATAKLIDAMQVREKKYGTNIEQDLKILGVHLDNSNAPSKLISMKLKDIRAGYKLGNCIFARAKEIAVPTDAGGPGLDGGCGVRTGKTAARYSDQDLINRFASSATRESGGGVMMTEEEAKNFQKKMRAAASGAPVEEEKDSKKKKKKSRSRSRRKGSSSRSRGRRKSRSRDRSSKKKDSGKKRSRSKSDRRSRSRSRRRGSSKEKGRRRD